MIHKYRAILCEGLEHPWVSLSVGERVARTKPLRILWDDYVCVLYEGRLLEIRDPVIPPLHPCCLVSHTLDAQLTLESISW